MISSMREYFRSLKFILVIIIVAFVATSVIYFGSNAISGFSGKHNVIASVNGEEIPAERFRRGQANIISMYERASKQKITPEQAEKMGLNKQVMGDLVRDAMIVQSANREGIQVPDDELRKRIQEMKEFQVDGRFSRDQYLKLLRMARFEPSEFEAEMRRQILREKMENIVMGGAKITEAELRDIYDLYYGRVKAEWASIEVPPLMAAIAVPDSEIEPYVKSHQAQFTKPERRRFEYVLVDPGTFPQPVPEQDIEAYYKEHGAEFDQPKRVHVAHVLVRVPPVGGSEAENGAKAKVEAVIKRAQAGEDFAKIAKSTSEDTANAAQGGDLGWISAGELVPQFEQAAFALKKGEVSPAPVRTPFGYHAIKVLDTKEGGRVPLKEVAPKIKDKLSLERGDIAARDKAEAIRKDLLAAPNFIAEAKKLGFEARDATIAKGEPFGGIGRDPALEEAMFSLSMGGVSAPVKTRTGYAVVKAVAQIPAGVPPLAELKPQVVEAIKRERAEAQAVERAKALIASLAKGGDFAAAAKAAGFTTGQIPFFSRAEPPKDRSGAPNSVLLAALQTAAGQVAEPVKAGTSVFVVKTLERQPPDAQGFDKQRAELEKQLTEQKRRQFFESWLRAQRASTKVEVAGQLVPADAL